MKTVVSYFVLLIFSSAAFGQSDSLSLLQAIDKTEDIIWSNYPLALKAANEWHQKILTSSCERCKARSYLMMGKIYWADGKYPKALDFFQQSLNEAHRLKDLGLWATATDLIATTYYYQAYYDSAIVYYQKSYDQYVASQDFEGMVKVLNNISLMYHRQGNFQKSIEYLFRCEKVREEHPEAKHDIEALGAMGSLMVDTLYYRQQIAENLKETKVHLLNNDQEKLSTAYHNLGKSHRQLEEYKTAARYFVKSSRILEKLGASPEWDQAGIDYRDAGMRDSSLYYHQLSRRTGVLTTRPNRSYYLELTGDAFKYFGEFDSALVYYKRALEMDMSMNNRISFTGQHKSLVDVYTGLKRYDEAEYHLNEGLRLAKEVALIHKRNLLNSGKKLYEKKGDFATALRYANLLSSLSDSLNHQETAINLTRMQAEYQSAKKERELGLVRNQNIRHELTLKNRNITLLSLGGVTLISVVFIAVFARQRNKIKTKNMALDLANKEQLMLLREVHHRVKNNLQLIASLISLQSSHMGNPEVARELEKTRARIMSIALIHQKLYQHDTVSPIDLHNFLHELIENILSTFSGEQTLEQFLDIAPVNVDIETAIPIGLIVNELVTNSIKHGLAGTTSPTLTVSLTRSEGKLILRISDNGSGISWDSAPGKDSGFGLKLVEILLKRLSGAIEVSHQKGTHWKIEIANF